MCGRARCSLAREAVMTATGVPEQRWRDSGHYRPSYNCSPGAWIPVLRLGTDGTREVQTMKWGLVPGFTRLAPGERPDHYRMFNARCESLTQKSVFSRLLPGKRCVVLLDGFYEWHSQGGGGGAASRKQPYHITTADGSKQPAMYMAGLYDTHRAEPNGEPLYTFTIVTTDSSKPLAWLHDRMPVILTTPEEVAEWLGEVECGKGATSGKPGVADQAASPTRKDTEPAAAGGDAAQDLAAPRSPSAGAVAAVLAATATPAKRGAAALPTGVGSASPSTPSSLSCRGRVSGGPGSGGGPLGRCSAERVPAGTAATDAIEILDDEENDADGGRCGGGGGGDKVEDAAGSSGEDGDVDDGDERCSQGKVGSSQEERKGRRRGQHGGAPKAQGDAVSEAVRQQCEELVEKICRPYDGPLLKWHPVTPEMSKPGYDKPDCCKDVRTKKGSISSFFKPAPKGAAPPAGPATAVKKEEEQQRPEAEKDTGGARQGGAEAKADVEELPEEAPAATRNPDECEVSGGDVGKQGLKRRAEGQSEGAGPLSAKKR